VGTLIGDHETRGVIDAANGWDTEKPAFAVLVAAPELAAALPFGDAFPVHVGRHAGAVISEAGHGMLATLLFLAAAQTLIAAGGGGKGRGAESAQDNGQEKQDGQLLPHCVLPYPRKEKFSRKNRLGAILNKND
jgi:hypothetical protein